MDNLTTKYGSVHADRRNLIIHLVTQPVFVVGLATSLFAPFTAHPWFAALGALAMLLAIGLQGRGHRFEHRAPAPFNGPADVIRRLLVEQLITFPRFVLSGELARALQHR